jgi:hypothetical protein
VKEGRCGVGGGHIRTAPQSDWLRLRPSLVGAGLSSRSCGEGEGLWVWRMGREGGEQRGV